MLSMFKLPKIASCFFIGALSVLTACANIDNGTGKIASASLVTSAMSKGSNTPLLQEQENEVTLAGRQILVGGSQYTIKGICYHPVPQGSDQRDFATLTQDLAIMKEAGINTIRVYAPIEEKAVLDEIDAAGLKVIIGFGCNQEGDYDILSGTFIDYVERYKGHSAILLWELGNEYNYHPEWFEGDLSNWYNALNKAAQMIHDVDPTHLVSTAHGELPDELALSLSPNVDVWGLNVYRWDQPGTIAAEWAAISDKPLFLSEAGADSYMAVSKDQYSIGDNQQAQADATENILDEVFDNADIISGVALFAFVDEFWKAGDNDVQDIGTERPFSSGVPYDGTANEEYWGLLEIDRTRKQAFNVVKEKFLNVPQRAITANIAY